MIYDSEKKDLYWEIAGLKHKLKQYKDIEEELGIDLNIFFKAFDGLFYKKDSEIKFSCHIAVIDWAIYILEESMKIGEGVSLRLKDYGKTWALTKEELENGRRYDTV